MNLKHDNVFYRIFSSIRYDWSYGIDERADWLLEILSHTTVFDKEEMKKTLIAMKESFLEDLKRDYDDRWFDGRSWAKGHISYLDAWEWISLLYIDLHYPDKKNPAWSFPVLDEDDDNCHDDVEILYKAWKKQQDVKI